MEYVIERGMRILPEASWQPVLQRSIDAFYEGRNKEGTEACIRLLQATGLPDDIRELTFRNQTFYAQPLAALVEGARWTVPEAPGLEGQGGHGLSPVLAGDRMIVFLRVTVGEGAGAPVDFLLTLDDDLGITEVAILGDETGEAASFHDVRPFFADGVLQAGVILRATHGDRLVRAGVVDLVGGAWQNLHSFGPRAGQFKAGWSPLVTDAGVYFVSWWEPTEVFRRDAETSAFERAALRMAPHVVERFAGGSQGVAVPGGYLFLVNERVAFDAGKPLVFSRFARIDEDFRITDISPQFFVKERGQNAASGLARRGDRLIAGFTTEDAQALLATMNLNAALATLVPVDGPGPKRKT